MTNTVSNNPESLRYELVLDGDRLGFIDYRIDGDTIDLLHTEVQKDSTESGLGGTLVRGALDQIRAESNYRVIPSCPFVKRWIGEHSEYADLLDR
jgi:hypothetical protein